METDILVIGGGIAGLSYAIRCAAFARVTVLTKRERTESNTLYAQGGIAAVVSPSDSFEAHVRDTLAAGDGLCNRAVVEEIVAGGPAAVERLVAAGIDFSRDASGRYDLGREGGHSARRVLHASDFTGRAIQERLLARAAEEKRIQILENTSRSTWSPPGSSRGTGRRPGGASAPTCWTVRRASSSRSPRG